MIKGETIVLAKRGESRTDPFGAITYVPELEVVENVIVGSPSTEAAAEELNLTGKHIAFVLGIPKGDTHDWKDKVILIRGERYRTIGFPLTQTDANVPGKHNTQVKVERYE